MYFINSSSLGFAPADYSRSDRRVEAKASSDASCMGAARS
jgi:hypothetical protein